MDKLKLSVVAATLLLAGCVSLAPQYQTPELPVPQQFSRTSNGLVPLTTRYQDTGWRTFFADPQVRLLIDEALRNNRDLRMATLKVQEARAQYRVTDADRYPQLNGASQANYSGGIKGDNVTERQYQVGVDLSFELDFFSRLKNLSEANRESFLASQAAQRAVHILLVATVAQNYFSLRLADEQLNIARETLQNYQQSYALVEQQLMTGSSSLLAVEQARGLIESTRAEIALREGQRAQAQTTLQLVLGNGQNLPTLPLSTSDLNPVTLPANLSSEILRQRPDLMEAEHQLRAANANIGAARAAFYPSISLTSGLAASSTDLTNLFAAGSGMWSFVPKIEVPIFNAGRNQANLTLAEVRQQQSVVNYQQKIQTAFKQVADVLALRDSISKQIAAQQRYLASLQITLQRARGLYASGAVSYIEVLDAQRALFSTRQTLLDLQYNQQVNEINLFNALGGGWTE